MVTQPRKASWALRLEPSSRPFLLKTISPRVPSIIDTLANPFGRLHSRISQFRLARSDLKMVDPKAVEEALRAKLDAAVVEVIDISGG